VNLAIQAPGWLFYLLVAALAVAAIEDVVRLRISNLTCGLVALGAIVAAMLAGPNLALVQNAAVFIVILILGTIGFSRGIVGGGDVKLFAAVGLWVGFSSATLLAMSVFLAGGAVAIVSIVYKLLSGRKGGLRNRQIPYAVAIAIGATALFYYQRSIETQPFSETSASKIVIPASSTR